MATPTPPKQSIPPAQTPNPYTFQGWFPKPFATPEIDHQELDLAIKFAYTNLYQTQYAATQAVAPLQGSKVSAGALVVAGGSMKGIATGLSTLSNVVVSIDNGGTPHNYTTDATPSRSLPGTFDVYIYQPTTTANNTPILATGVSVTVRWNAWGT